MSVAEAIMELKRGNVVSFDHIDQSEPMSELVKLVNNDDCARYDEHYAYPHGCYDNTNYFD